MTEDEKEILLKLSGQLEVTNKILYSQQKLLYEIKQGNIDRQSNAEQQKPEEVKESETEKNEAELNYTKARMRFFNEAANVLSYILLLLIIAAIIGFILMMGSCAACADIASNF